MELTLILIFIIGYSAITFEHALKIDKLIPALLMMTISWALIAFNTPDAHVLGENLLHHEQSRNELIYFKCVFKCDG